MILTLTGGYSVPVLIGELLGWVLGVAGLVPGRLGVLAAQARETAAQWGIPVAEVSDQLLAFPVRLALATLVVAVVGAVAAVVHGLRKRRRASSAR